VPGVAGLEWSARISAHILHGEVLDEAFGHGPVGAEPAYRKRNAERRIGEEFVQQMNNRASGQDAAALAGLENLVSRAAGFERSSGTKIQSALSNPRRPTSAVGDFGMRRQTRSPFLHPVSPQ